MNEPTRLKFGEGSPVSLDWQTMPEGKAKYQAYMCSREWAVLKRAVAERSGGICERCKLHQGENVHHQTYKRKYREKVDDLIHYCRQCHKFIHGHSDVDPIAEEIKRQLGRDRSLHNLLTCDGTYNPNLKCPYPDCGCENVHFRKCQDEDSMIIIPMFCEEEHEWEMCFQFSQGTARGWIQKIKEVYHND